jgi:NodT family efflux transporter outer membrane factor (OMF) lipoprotein
MERRLRHGGAWGDARLALVREVKSWMPACAGMTGGCGHWAPSVCGALLAALLTGCMVGPDYQRPDAPTPIVYKELAGWKQATPLDTINRGAWWSIYNDPELDQLEDQVVISNQNVKSFEAAYRAAAALVRETQAQLFPTVGATSSVTRTRSGGGSGGVTSSGAVAGGRGSGSINTQYSVEGSASWTPDIWGKIRRQIESNVAAAQVSAADLANATLSAQATLAIAYVNLRFEDSLQKLLTETVAQFQHALDITRNQYRAGTASSADVVTAQAQLQTTQAQLIGVGVLRGQFEHAIAMLTGHPPADLSIPVTAMQKDVPVVPTGIPSTLLERRPDIAAAERQMQEENALIGVAISAYYPDISLTALAGFAGSPLSQLFTTASRVWSLGASASETIFDAGARTAAVAVARATYDEFVADYRQTVLAAFQQVEDQLVALRVLQQQAVAQDAAVASARHAVEVTLNQYLAGTVAYTSVITEQTLELSDEQTVLTIQQSRLVASVTLIQSLGGGWQASDVPSNFAIEPKQLVP